MQNIQLKDLLEAGCHFGHEVKRWHPKAKTFIFTARNKIHIIDLIKTKSALTKACTFAQQLGEQGKELLFVGTKRQAREIILTEAKRAGCPYFSQRWVGGFLTNWSEIKKNLDKLNKMEEDKAKGAWQKFPKHEQVGLDKQRLLLNKFYQGVKHLKQIPDALFVIDIKKEDMVIREAVNKGLPVIGMVDTNSDPSQIDYPIPANDDAVKSVGLIVKYIAGAYLEGKNARKNAETETGKKINPVSTTVDKKELKVESKLPQSKTSKTKEKKV